MNRQVPAMQPQMQAVPILDKSQRILCPCGGKGIIFQAAFLAKSLLVGSRPEVAAALVVTCNKCGEDIEPPFETLGDIKEAS